MLAAKPQATVRTLATVVGAAATVPACVLVLRLLYIGLAMLYCIATLDTSTLPRVEEHAWLRAGDPATTVDNDTAAAAWPVPKIIHQTYRTAEVPQQWIAATNSCRALHSDYEYRFWTDESARVFLAASYPWFLPTWDAYPYPIQRADALRYFVLFHHGGLYADLDVGCERRLDSLRAYPLVLPTTDPTGFSNDVMVAAPRHPLMRRAIHALRHTNHCYGTRYPTVMFSTGPMFLTLQFMAHRRTAAASSPAGRVFTLPDHLYSDDCGRALFRHYEGSSWHGADSRIIFWLYTTIRWSLPLITLVAGLVVGHLGTLALWRRQAPLPPPPWLGGGGAVTCVPRPAPTVQWSPARPVARQGKDH